MASGIKDKVAIIGMGCSRFGERWDCGTPELLAEAFEEFVAEAEFHAKPSTLLARGAKEPLLGLPVLDEEDA